MTRNTPPPLEQPPSPSHKEQAQRTQLKRLLTDEGIDETEFSTIDIGKVLRLIEMNRIHVQRSVVAATLGRPESEVQSADEQLENIKKERHERRIQDDIANPEHIVFDSSSPQEEIDAYIRDIRRHLLTLERHHPDFVRDVMRLLLMDRLQKDLPIDEASLRTAMTAPVDLGMTLAGSGQVRLSGEEVDAWFKQQYNDELRFQMTDGFCVKDLGGARKS